MKTLLALASRSISAAFIALLLALPGWAQQSVPQQPAAPQQPQPAQQSQSIEPAPPSDQATAERRISPQEAQELLRSVDEILQFVSKDTGLAIKHPVKRKLASREEVRNYIEDRMKDDEDRRRLERSEVVLKKFGLLPREFNLKVFLVDLLKEQVAGFYNTKDKTVYLLDWVEPEAQKPVLAHELTHALQDQNFNLEKWVKAAKGGKPGSAEALMEDERIAARQAVSEGQAMVSLINYMLAPTGQSLLTSPMIADAMIAGMAQSGQTPLYTRAPMFLRELLIFPYQYGLKFERDLLVAKGTQGAFRGAFEKPPSQSRQVMQPTTYLQNESLPEMPVPPFEEVVGKSYQNYDLSVLGQFDVWLLSKQYAGQSSAEAIAPKWRGGYYYAAVKPGTPKPANGTARIADSALAIAYASTWADADAAEQFAAIYANYIPKRYPQARELGTQPKSKVGTFPTGAAEVNVSIAERLGGNRLWATEQGPVSVEVSANQVLVLEGFDEATAAKLRAATLGSH
ncbi:MAG TPA: hypothetical protein VD837_16565 [Terriglobales bacterium]|nr:hypothetical protein [Terriglobales bacterium]